MYLHSHANSHHDLHNRKYRKSPNGDCQWSRYMHIRKGACASWLPHCLLPMSNTAYLTYHLVILAMVPKPWNRLVCHDKPTCFQKPGVAPLPPGPWYRLFYADTGEYQLHRSYPFGLRHPCTYYQVLSIQSCKRGYPQLSGSINRYVIETQQLKLNRHFNTSLLYAKNILSSDFM